LIFPSPAHYLSFTRDGVIEATIDHEHGWLASNEIIDVYSTEEPQKAFHRLMPFFLSSSIITHKPSL
jgi:hypothetical protein